MSFSITLNGHTAADSSDIKEIAEDAYRKLKALPGATNISLSGWANESTGGSVSLVTPPDEAHVPTTAAETESAPPTEPGV